MSRPEARAYSVRKGNAWALIVVVPAEGIDGGHPFSLMIMSDYGNWSYFWSHPGKDVSILDFLRGMANDPGYLVQKLCSDYASTSASQKAQQGHQRSCHQFAAELYPLFLEKMAQEAEPQIPPLAMRPHTGPGDGPSLAERVSMGRFSKCGHRSDGTQCGSDCHVAP